MEQEAWQVLIVEDDERLAELTREYLESNGLRVSIEGNGALAAERILREQPDLVILDLMLPGEDGLSICSRVRSGYDGAILMLTARTDDLDQIQGLDLGADDYVCKPVRPRLLLARIQALLRRSEPLESAAQPVRRLQFGPLVIDEALREAWLNDAGIELTSAEFDLLWLLVLNAGRILSREEIFTALRGIGYDGQDRSIDVRISRIRPKRPRASASDQDHSQQGLSVRAGSSRRNAPVNSIFLRIYGGMCAALVLVALLGVLALHLLNEVRGEQYRERLAHGTFSLMADNLQPMADIERRRALVLWERLLGASAGDSAVTAIDQCRRAGSWAAHPGPAGPGPGGAEWALRCAGLPIDQRTRATVAGRGRPADQRATVSTCAWWLLNGQTWMRTSVGASAKAIR